MMAAKIQVDKYFEALERLKARGEPINNDAVAKEAGSGKGSIKKSRAGYAALIAAIEQAALEQKQAHAAADPIPQLRQQLATLQQRLDSALEREVCLLNEVYNLREEVRQLSSGRLTVVSNKTR
jgi:cell division protein ZapA (FtsZ GTPase activity inhibitor)